MTDMDRAGAVERAARALAEAASNVSFRTFVQINAPCDAPSSVRAFWRAQSDYAAALSREPREEGVVAQESYAKTFGEILARDICESEPSGTVIEAQDRLQGTDAETFLVIAPQDLAAAAQRAVSNAFYDGEIDFPAHPPAPAGEKEACLMCGGAKDAPARVDAICPGRVPVGAYSIPCNAMFHTPADRDALAALLGEAARYARRMPFDVAKRVNAALARIDAASGRA